jgi:metal-responsive CopG/Arc/MetJ family transcriptional regulator
LLKCYHKIMTKEKHTVNQTFSLPVELVEELHRVIKSMERSAYVAELIRQGLNKKKEELRQEYVDMGKDKEQSEILKDWEATVGDNIDDEEW